MLNDGVNMTVFGLPVARLSHFACIGNEYGRVTFTLFSVLDAQAFVCYFFGGLYDLLDGITLVVAEVKGGWLASFV